jgi:hypothetical protein
MRIWFIAEFPRRRSREKTPGGDQMIAAAWQNPWASADRIKVPFRPASNGGDP